MTPRRTRLLRVPTLPAFQHAIAAAVAAAGPDCAVLVPTRSAARQLRRTLAAGAAAAAGERRPAARILTRDAWHRQLHARLDAAPRLLSEVEREALARAAARDAVRGGWEPPFRLRPALVRLMLGFYDDLARHGRTIDAFERLAVDDLEPSAAVDRGARRLLDQTRFLVAAFRAFAARVEASGALDEHRLRRRLLRAPAARPLREAVITVADRAAQPAGLYPADFDLAARLPGLRRVTLVATDALLDCGYRERLEDLLPGLDEERFDGPAVAPPVLVTPSVRKTGGVRGASGAAGAADGARAAGGDGGAGGGAADAAAGASAGPAHFIWRDREEELQWVVGRTAAASTTRGGAHTAVVVQRPLPWLYLASSVCADHDVAFAAHDGLPLAGEAFAAAVDVVLACVRADFAREPLVALLRVPQLALYGDGEGRDAAAEALDRELAARRFAGGAAALRDLQAQWVTSPPRAGSRAAAASAALAGAVRAADALAPLGAPLPPARGLDVLLAFLADHAAPTAAPLTDVAGPRDSAVRDVILEGLAALRDAAAAVADAESDLDAAGLADLVRQWLEGRPGPAPAPPPAAALEVVDGQAAPYGRFDDVHLAGLVDGEWPPPPVRNVFYPAALLAGLGWPRESARLAAGRAAFRDLLGLARARVALSAFALEDDAAVTPSVWLDLVPGVGLPRAVSDGDAAEADPPPEGPGAADSSSDSPAPPAPALPAGADADWLAWRIARAVQGGAAEAGVADPAARGPYAVSALDRYLECPFRHFARDVLGLEEDAEDEDDGAFTPQRRGIFLHRVFEAFFRAWQAAGEGAVTLGSVDRALDRFAGVAEAEIARLAAADQAVARTWLLGSPAAAGLAERLLMAEVEHPGALVERRLEMRLDGEHRLTGAHGPRRVALRGTADRIDLHADGAFRVLDYKAERAPRAARALQLPLYASCAERKLGAEGAWRAAGAAYVAFGDPRLETPAGGADLRAAMRAAERRAVEVVERIERGAFPVRPADASRCRFCAYPTVCRKDHAGGA